MIRRSVWEQVPFDETLEASEDKLWASQVLARGFKIRACAEALWLTNDQAAKEDQRKRRNLEQLGFYRFTGRRPLTWPVFLVRILRSLLEAPVIAARHAAEQIAWNAQLVSIPWQARRGNKNER